jgi:hypothetical protein
MNNLSNRLITIKWLRFSFINLCIVAGLGTLMRYKIVYSLPWLHQKYILHAHSHFAFSGWISQALITLMISALAEHATTDLWKKYRWVLWLNLFSAYGMLLSFPFQGYGLYSISFSTLSIFTSYAFAIILWKDLNKLKYPLLPSLWFKAGLLFNVISSIGAFSLAFMMATKAIHQTWYLAAVYFFLHFQYNGWFFFASAGLFYTKFIPTAFLPIHKKIFWLFTFACVPAYFLSALWLPIPGIVYLAVVVAAIIQLYAWLMMLKTFKNIRHIEGLGKPILVLAAIACTIKIFLQTGSTIPSLSDIAFGFRPIIIGYLHLVLLGVITLFLLGYTMAAGYSRLNKLSKTGIYTFVMAVILNEIVLMLQGITFMSSIVIPYTNETLLYIAFLLFTGIAIFTIGKSIKIQPKND